MRIPNGERGFSISHQGQGLYQLIRYRKGVRESILTTPDLAFEQAVDMGRQFAEGTWEDVTDQCTISQLTVAEYNYPIHVLKYKGYIAQGPYMRMRDGRLERRTS